VSLELGLRFCSHGAGRDQRSRRHARRVTNARRPAIPAAQLSQAGSPACARAAMGRQGRANLDQGEPPITRLTRPRAQAASVASCDRGCAAPAPASDPGRNQLNASAARPCPRGSSGSCCCARRTPCAWPGVALQAARARAYSASCPAATQCSASFRACPRFRAFPRPRPRHRAARRAQPSARPCRVYAGAAAARTTASAVSRPGSRTRARLDRQRRMRSASSPRSEAVGPRDAASP
jgi:hypothetical protein